MIQMHGSHPKSARYLNGELGSDTLSILVKWITTRGLRVHYGTEYKVLCDELNECRREIAKITASFAYSAFDISPNGGRPSIGAINYWYNCLGKGHCRLAVYSMRFSAAAWSIRQLCFVQLAEVEHRLDDEFSDNQEIVVYAEAYGFF